MIKDTGNGKQDFKKGITYQDPDLNIIVKTNY